MAAAKIPRRLAVFLGAGASAPFGYPVTAGILPRIWTGLHTPSGPGSWTRWAGMKSRTEARRAEARRLMALLETLVPGLKRGVKLDGGVSIIDVISLVDQMVAEGGSPDPKITLRQLLEARQVLNKAINGVLQGRSKLRYAARLADWFIRVATEQETSRLSIISTNYDTTVELALFNRFLRHGASVGQMVDLGMPWRDAFKDLLHVRPTNARLAVFKLHGALNWLRCEVCGHVTMNVTQRIAPLDNWEKRSPQGYNVCHCNGLLRSILVTPSVVRDVRDASLLAIWRAALEELRLADEWVFVGYSLPTEDIAIRSMLLRAWHARRRKGLRVRVIQYEPPRDPKDKCPPKPSETHTRYRLFFPDSALRETDYTRDGLLPYVDGLELLSQPRLDARMRRFFKGRSPSELRRRDKIRRMIDAERRLARDSRRS